MESTEIAEALHFDTLDTRIEQERARLVTTVRQLADHLEALHVADAVEAMRSLGAVRAEKFNGPAML